METIYRKVFIKSGADLPEKADRYFVHHKKADRNEATEWFFDIDSDYWLSHYDWYLQPVELPSDEEMETIAEMFPNGSDYIEGFCRWLINK